MKMKFFSICLFSAFILALCRASYVTNVPSLVGVFTAYSTNAPSVNTNLFSYDTNVPSTSTNLFEYATNAPGRVYSLSYHFTAIWLTNNAHSGNHSTAGITGWGGRYYYNDALSTDGMVVFTNFNDTGYDTINYLTFNSSGLQTLQENIGSKIWAFSQAVLEGPSPATNFPPNSLNGTYQTLGTNILGQWYLMTITSSNYNATETFGVVLSNSVYTVTTNYP